MITTPVEIEGTAEEIATEIERWPGRRMRLTVLPQREDATPVRETRPIHEVIAAIVEDVPKEEWANLPADLSDNLDHYIYGTPKKA